MRVTRVVAALALAALPIASLSACAPESKAEKSASSDILTMKLPSDVSAKGVVLAAVLLSTADIEGALAEGLVTPAEVDFAQQAIDDGMLNHWRERAETEITGK